MIGKARNSSVKTLLVAGLLGATGAVQAQETAALPDNLAPNDAPNDPAILNEIIVTGEGPYTEDSLQQSVRDITLRGRFGGRALPRFNAAICLHVAGLAPAAAQAMQARISQNVRTLGLKMGEDGCRVNALVVSSFEPETFIKEFGRVQPWAFTPRGTQLIRAAVNRGDPAIPWSSSSFFNFAGETLASNRGQAEGLLAPSGALVNFGVPGSSFGGIVDPNGSRAIMFAGLNRMNSAIVFDADRLSGFTVTQVADYATMHLLGDLQPRVDFSNDIAHSILEMFNDGPANAPESLTLLDRSYLHGLYAMRDGEAGSRLERSVKVAYGELLGAVCDDVPGCDPDNPLISESS